MTDETRAAIQALDKAVMNVCRKDSRAAVKRYENAIAKLAGVSAQDVATAINGAPETQQ